MQRPMITFRLDEPYNDPGEVQAGVSEEEALKQPGVITRKDLEEAASPSRPAEPAGVEAPFFPQPPASRMKTAQWITAAATTVLSLTAAYYAVTSNRNSRSRYQLLANSTRMALAATEESTRVDQQAWVGLPLPAAYPLTREGGGFAIKLRNFGKTPALNVFITDYVVIEDLDQLDGMQQEAANRPMAAGTLMPGGEFGTDIGFRTSPEGVAGLAEGKVRAVNYALITYEDIYHRPHTTQSCFYWHGGLRAPLPCEQFNTVE